MQRTLVLCRYLYALNVIQVTTTVHNIIVGKLWVDNHGDMDIVGEAGQAAGYVAHLKYLPYGYFSKDTQRKVTGVIKDPQGVVSTLILCFFIIHTAVFTMWQLFKTCRFLSYMLH